MAHLAEREGNIVFQGACIRNIGIHTFFETELFVTAHVVPLPVACTGRAFAPVFLVIGPADIDLVGGALVKTCEIASEHHEVRPHSKGKRNVMVIDNAAG